MTAAKAAKADALGQKITFEFDGITFDVPSANEWDLDALEAYEDGKIVALIRALLGVEGWAKFRAKKRTVEDLNALFSALQKAMGIEGN
jgi:hypothetical protein